MISGLLDTLVGGIAHELNNKLTRVLGLADLLISGKQVPQFADYISKSAEEAANIIRQLLQLSKPETGNRQAIDLRNVVDESLMMLKFKLRESQADVQTVPAGDRIEAFADAAQIKQVVINLVLNSLHALGLGSADRAGELLPRLPASRALSGGKIQGTVEIGTADSQKLGLGEWLRDNGDAPGRQFCLKMPLLGVGGDKNEALGRRRLRLAQPKVKLRAVHFRHTHIGDDECIAGVGEALERGDAVGNDVHLALEAAANDLADQAGHERLVFDDQHPDFFFPGRDPGWHFSFRKADAIEAGRTGSG